MLCFVFNTPRVVIQSGILQILFPMATGNNAALCTFFGFHGNLYIKLVPFSSRVLLRGPLFYIPRS